MADWRNILEKAAAPVALLSFGKDSILMLDLMREVRTDFPAIHFGPVDEFAKGIIRQYNLTVYSYAAAQRSIVIGDETVLVSDYDFGGQLMPVVETVEPGDTCCGTVNNQPRLNNFGYDWTDTFLGWKETDKIPLVIHQPHIIDGMRFGNTRLWTPIRHLTDTEVYAELARRELPIPAPDADTRLLCTKCLRGEAFCPLQQATIPAFKWNPAASLEAFQQRFAAN